MKAAKGLALAAKEMSGQIKFVAVQAKISQPWAQIIVAIVNPGNHAQIGAPAALGEGVFDIAGKIIIVFTFL